MSRKNYIQLGASSNPSAGAFNVNSNQNQFTINISPALKIPSEAYNCKIYLRKATVPYRFININSSNNKIYFSDDAGDTDKYSLTLDTGFYSVKGINEAIQRQMENFIMENSIGTETFTKTLIQVVADTASGLVNLQINKAGYLVYFKTADTAWDLLGFTSNRVMPSSGLTTGSTYFTANNQPKFNLIKSLCLQSSLTNSYFYNGKTTNILDVIPIGSTAPNFNIQYSPNPNYTFLDGNNLIGGTINSITFKLTDQDLNDVSFPEGQYYNLDFTIEFETQSSK